jgi:predicted nucleic acid-binding protein
VIKYLLDTNAISELRKPKPHKAHEIDAWVAGLALEMCAILNASV